MEFHKDFIQLYLPSQGCSLADKLLQDAELKRFQSSCFQTYEVFRYILLKRFAENNRFIQMGCACNPAAKKKLLQKRDTPIGILRVTILGVQYYEDQKYSKANLKIRVSNQHFSTDNLPPPDKDIKAGQTFTFCINSFYKAHGRTIQAGFFDSNSLVAFGSVDINPIIEQKQIQELRCLLNKDGQKQHGYVLLRAAFEALPFNDLTFRFDQATIRRKTGSCGADNVAVRLTIGEQTLETQFLPDSLENPPIWADTKYNFKVPEGVKKGFLELVDDKNQVVGSTQLNLENYSHQKEGEENLDSLTLFYKDGQKSPVAAADLKYTFINGRYADFKPRNQIMTSMIRAIAPQGDFSASEMSKSRQQKF